MEGEIIDGWMKRESQRGRTIDENGRRNGCVERMEDGQTVDGWIQ